MKDGLGRRSVKALARRIYGLLLALHRRSARRAGLIRYELGGACLRSGQCCESPGIQVSKLTFYLPVARRLFLAWQAHVNGFLFQRVDPKSRVFYFRCTHYDHERRQCDSYESRPGMCRDYPLLLTEQPSPQPLERCGYRLLDVKRNAMLQALESRGVSPEQMAKLKKGLHLE